MEIFFEDHVSYAIVLRAWFYIGFLCFLQANSVLGSDARDAWAKLYSDGKAKWAKLARAKNEDVRIEKGEVEN